MSQTGMIFCWIAGGLAALVLPVRAAENPLASQRHTMDCTKGSNPDDLISTNRNTKVWVITNEHAAGYISDFQAECWE